MKNSALKASYMVP